MQTQQAFEEHLTWMSAAGLAESTVDATRELLHRIDDELSWGLCAAMPEEIAGGLARSGGSPSTRATYRAHIVRFFEWAVRGPDPAASASGSSTSTPCTTYVSRSVR